MAASRPLNPGSLFLNGVEYRCEWCCNDSPLSHTVGELDTLGRLLSCPTHGRCWFWPKREQREPEPQSQSPSTISDYTIIPSVPGVVSPSLARRLPGPGRWLVLVRGILSRAWQLHGHQPINGHATVLGAINWVIACERSKVGPPYDLLQFSLEVRP